MRARSSGLYEHCHLFLLGFQGPWLNLLHHWPEAAACVAPAAASCSPPPSLSELSFLHTLRIRHTHGTPTICRTRSTRCLPLIQISSQCQVALLCIGMKRRRRPSTSLQKSNGTGNEWSTVCVWLGGWEEVGGKEWCVVLIFCCCITRYHRASNNTPFISCQFCMQKSKLGVARFSAEGLTRWKSKCWLGFVLTWSLRGLIEVHLVVAEFSSLWS